MTAPVQLVWFKRDLRLRDHAPLFEASRRGPVLPLYVYEPSLYGSVESSAAQLTFINDSLSELRDSLTRIGGDLTLRVGEMPEVLEQLFIDQPFVHLWAHEETGTYDTYQRDRRVRAWAKERGIPFTELPKDGVVRRLATRDDWARRWRGRMRQPLVPSPEHLLSPELEPGPLRHPQDFGLTPTQPLALAGGEEKAHELLQSFLEKRSRVYRKGMASPVTAFGSSSRLSPYLAWGNLSVRQAYQLALARYRTLKQEEREGDGDDQSVKSWRRSLASFLSRLSWHDHFIQKLEDEPELEFRNPNRGFDGLREGEFNEVYFGAWKAGQTGYPLVDACMRSLKETGWLPFRMRAFIVSFASYHLWLHWRETGRYLGAQWLDFEPGIHWPQMHMQSGVTGINTVRIYSPRKQALDQDPEGVFIRRWVPELESLPDAYLAEPHVAPPLVQGMVGCVVGKDYPAPIVDPKEAYAEAKRRMGEAKASEEVQRLKGEVYRRHGSRATPLRRRRGW